MKFAIFLNKSQKLCREIKIFFQTLICFLLIKINFFFFFLLLSIPPLFSYFSFIFQTKNASHLQLHLLSSFGSLLCLLFSLFYTFINLKQYAFSHRTVTPSHIFKLFFFRSLVWCTVYSNFRHCHQISPLRTFELLSPEPYWLALAIKIL